MRGNLSLCAVAALLAILGMTVGVATAADGTWTVITSGTWSDTANWLDGIVADGQSATANITSNITGNINVPGGWVISPRLAFGNVGMSVEGRPLGMDEYPLFIEVWGRMSPYGVVTLVPESIPDKLKAFWVVGGNPLVSMADTNASTGPSPSPWTVTASPSTAS